MDILHFFNWVKEWNRWQFIDVDQIGNRRANLYLKGLGSNPTLVYHSVLMGYDFISKLFFLVHEGPINIGLGGTRTTGRLQPNMFFSDEPGYYKDNEYGIRLETILRVVEKNATEKPYGKSKFCFTQSKKKMK